MSYDISSITVSLTPKPLSAAVKERDDIGYVTWELAAHLPIKDGPMADSLSSDMRSMAVDGSEDGSDEEESDAELS